MKHLILSAVAALAVGTSALPAAAADISTHVLDISRGEGGADIPVTLSRADAAGGWVQIAATRTQANGRAEAFVNPDRLTAGTYLLQFDMTQYDAMGTPPFFPTITVVFTVTDSGAAYHVPVLVSPYGYSTYRGN